MKFGRQLDKSKTIEGIVLFRKDIGETDRLLTVFSKNEGKIKIIARGTRKLKSKNASHIEPFSIGKYSIVPGKTFYVLTGADSAYTNHEIVEDLKKYNQATYLCELLDIVGVEGQKMPNTYERFAENLIDIARGNLSPTDIIISEFILLSELGYSADYFHCKKCNNTLQEHNLYCGGFEGVFCDNCSPTNKNMSKDLLKILRLLEKGQFDKINKISNVNKLDGDLNKVVTDYLNEILPKSPKCKL